MKLILKNIFSLGLVQGINLLTPLLLTPFLVSRLGFEHYGIIATATAFSTFFMLFTDFGINVTGVRRIVFAKKEAEVLDAVLSNIFSLKFILIAFTFIIYLLIITIVPLFKNNFLVYLFSFSLIIAHSLMPSWYYQAFENTAKTIVPSVIIKFVSFLAVLIIVKLPADIMYVNLILGTGNIILALVLIIPIYKNHSLSLKFFNKMSIIEEAKANMAIFISNISTAVYANLSVVILSFFVTPALLGIYSVAEKIIQFLKGFLAFIHYISYTPICNLIKEKQALSIFIKKTYRIVWACTFLLGVIICFVPHLFTSFFIKDILDRSIADGILQKMSFLIFIISLNMPFFQILLALKKDWLILKTVVVTALISLAIAIGLQFSMPVTGAIISMYIAEIIVAVYYWHHTKKLFPSTFNNKNRLLSRVL